MKRKIVNGLLCVGLALLLAGCGKSDGSTDGTMDQNTEMAFVEGLLL